MSLDQRNDARLAGRLIEGRMGYALIVGFAVMVAYGAASEFILPAFAQIEAAFEAARSAR